MHTRYLLSSLVALKKYLQYNIDTTVLQNKILGIWNLLMQKFGFSKMCHYVSLLQIGSQMR